jgi:hypothetical protein
MVYRITRRVALLFPAVVGLVALPAWAGEGVTVDHAWAPASAGTPTTGAAYLTLTGSGEEDAIVGVSTPVAASAEVHQSFVENGVSKMRPAPDLAIPAGKVVRFEPGGYHVMLIGLKQALVAGQSFPLTISFAYADAVTVDVQVRGRDHAAPAPGHEHMHME